MKECAFCPATSPKLTGEHFFSDWINGILPSRGFTITRLDEEGKANQWTSPSLNMKGKVVCGTCNNGWMSELEQHHAKPAMKDLILDNKAALLSPDRLKSIAYFAFKSAVIADCLMPERDPFFPAATRHRFASSLEIPRNVQMWLAAFKEGRQGFFRAVYHNTPTDLKRGFELYTHTFGAGYFIFQLVASRWMGTRISSSHRPAVTQGKGWNKFSIPFWPLSGESIFWPPNKQFSTRWAHRFANRWQDTNVPYWLKDH